MKPRYPNVLVIRLSDEQQRVLYAYADADDRPVSTLARRLIADGLTRMEKSTQQGRS